jgi:hypothetical protein
MNRQSLLRAALAASLAFGLVACQTAPPANALRLGAQLTGGAEVPPKSVPGTGMAEVTYNRDTGVLSWRVTYSGLTGPLTGAHFHGPAGPTANAGVVVPIASTASPITGEARITPTQAGDLMAGLWYLNLHTAANPGGEIRGQVMLRR